MEAFAVVVSVVVLIGVAGYLLGSLFRNIQSERRSSNVRKIWSNFGLSIAFATLFLVSWISQAVVQWPVFAEQQRDHGEQPRGVEYFLEFSQSTLENWQSEFLQLFSFVVLAALFIHHGSAESKDGEERIEELVKKIADKVGAK